MPELDAKIETTKFTSRPKRETVNVSFRLELACHARLIQQANQAGISIREWLERAILKNETRIIQRVKPHPDLRDLLFQVSRAGNNINQIAHKLNSSYVIGTIQKGEILDALDKLEAINEHLREAVSHAR